MRRRAGRVLARASGAHAGVAGRHDPSRRVRGFRPALIGRRTLVALDGPIPGRVGAPVTGAPTTPTAPSTAVRRARVGAPVPTRGCEGPGGRSTLRGRRIGRRTGCGASRPPDSGSVGDRLGRRCLAGARALVHRSRPRYVVAPGDPRRPLRSGASQGRTIADRRRGLSRRRSRAAGAEWSLVLAGDGGAAQAPHALGIRHRVRACRIRSKSRRRADRARPAGTQAR